MLKKNYSEIIKNKRGFSLIELIIVIAVLGIIITIGSLNFINFGTENNLELTAREIVSVLRNAQERSISREGNYKWGVYFAHPAGATSYYLLYQDASTTAVTRVNLRSNIEFLDPADSVFKDILFSSVSGLPNSSATIIISLKNDPSKTRIISINSNGQIGYQKPE